MRKASETGGGVIVSNRPIIDGVTCTRMIREKYGVWPFIASMTANAFPGTTCSSFLLSLSLLSLSLSSLSLLSPDNRYCRGQSKLLERWNECILGIIVAIPLLLINNEIDKTITNR